MNTDKRIASVTPKNTRKKNDMGNYKKQKTKWARLSGNEYEASEGTFNQNMVHQSKKKKNAKESKLTTQTEMEKNVQEENNDEDYFFFFIMFTIGIKFSY
ncbi:unnamed protein product [Acanthoscelides obtectus]|uniref:Uncharacterized protein n=1 Tax=Acanthoscelides obtectus TaxID=200917 RepID=A0A9P0K2T6_ACAOB|nr:unnamed protein product [Acanthoscelides obtectus]CAK1657062.1 hypothetical protein AOBTE_LOCUS20097 [Acanthoscelides obtectus]